MTFTPKVKIALGLLVVFLAGAAFGSWGRTEYTKRSFAKSLDYKCWSENVLKGMDEDLHLSPEQQRQAKEMLDATVKEATNSFTHLGQELVRLHVRIQAILTPEQQKKSTASFNGFRRELDRLNISLPEYDARTNDAPQTHP